MNCTYNQPPTGEVNGQPGSDIATKVWGQLSDTCNFNGQPQTEWTFDCNLGINPALSTDPVGGPANGWNFTTCTASPLLLDQPAGIFPVTNYGTCSSATSAHATIGSDGSVELSAAVGLPTGFRLRSATLSGDRLLYEPRGRGELLKRSSGEALGTIQLAASGKLGGTSGGTLLGSAAGEPPITLKLHRTPDHKAHVTLTMSRIGVLAPDACNAWPASVSQTTTPFALDTSLQLSDGAGTYSVSLPAEWTCTRSPGGAVSGLRTVAPPAPAQHDGLELSVQAPRAVIPGSTATYTIRLHNTRRGPSNPYISSLWHILARATLSPLTKQESNAVRGPRPVTARVNELRHGQTKVLKVRMRVPSGLVRASIHHACVSVSAVADSTQPAAARACSVVRGFHGPQAGLG